MNKKYTIKDIAEIAGVSKGTVDRVLHKRGKVSKTALEKVNTVLDRIDYRPNLIARNLKNTKIFNICVLLPNPKIDIYWEGCIDGINDAIEEFISFNIAIKTYFFNPTNTNSFIENNEEILKTSPDAVLIAPLFYKEAVEIVKNYNALGIISVTFNNYLKSNAIKSFVGQDLFQSGKVAGRLLEILVKKGLIAILHIDEDYENAIYVQEKEKGFRAYFNQVNNTNYTIKTCSLQHPNFKRSFYEFIEAHPNLAGIFVTTSKAFQVAEITSKLDKKIALVGYDLLKSNLNYLKSFDIDFLIHQNPKRQAYLGVVHLIEYFIFDKEIPTKKLLPIDIINSENANNYI